MNNARSVAGSRARSRWRGLPWAGLVFLLVLLALLGGFTPLVMPFGLPAGGVLETGQVVPERWWLATAVAALAYLISTWRIRTALRLWWLGVLLSGSLLAVEIFSHVASYGQSRVTGKESAAQLKVGVISALPLFWYQDKDIDEYLSLHGEVMPLSAASRHQLRAIDRLGGQSLNGLDSLLVAQPRALAPTELVELDAWIRKGGRAVILTDPLLIWPSELPLGDRRRPPLTSLLDPLLGHWGLRLEPVEQGREGLERRMLSSGHVLLTAGVSRYTLLPITDDVRCRLTEKGLIAACRVGRGNVRLIADADLIDPRLWLVDSRWAKSMAAYRSDAVMLVDGWLSDPNHMAIDPAPRRIVDDEAVLVAMRWAIVTGLIWVGLGWTARRRLWTE